MKRNDFAAIFEMPSTSPESVSESLIIENGYAIFSSAAKPCIETPMNRFGRELEHYDLEVEFDSLMRKLFWDAEVSTHSLSVYFSFTLTEETDIESIAEFAKKVSQALFFWNISPEFQSEELETRVSIVGDNVCVVTEAKTGEIVLDILSRGCLRIFGDTNHTVSLSKDDTLALFFSGNYGNEYYRLLERIEAFLAEYYENQ